TRTGGRRTPEASPPSSALGRPSATTCASSPAARMRRGPPRRSRRSSPAPPKVDVARLDRDALLQAITAALNASPDPEGTADLVASKGRINVAATGAEIGPAIKRLVPLQGYRWLAINGGDLFTASPLTMSTKVGILDPTGRVLKAADLPRAK